MAGEWIKNGGVWTAIVVVPVLVVLSGLLVWLIVWPFLGQSRYRETQVHQPTSLDIALSPQKFERIGVALELSKADLPVLETAVLLARAHQASLTLIHVVEGIGGKVYGRDAFDLEVRHDEGYIRSLSEKLTRDYQLKAETAMGYGNPVKEVVRLVGENDLDLLIMGSHRHGVFMDILMGQTVSAVRHAVEIPVLVVPQGWRV